MTASVLSVEDVGQTFEAGRRQGAAIDRVRLELPEGEGCATVGESGSAGSTAARLVFDLVPPSEERLRFRRQALRARRSMMHRRRTQHVRPDPLPSLIPRWPAAAAPRPAPDALRHGTPGGRPGDVARLLEEAGLGPGLARRRPPCLSGGRRRRIVKTGAQACRSELIVPDEPIPALDVLVRALALRPLRVLQLLHDLRVAHALTCIFVTHDLSVVRSMAGPVAVFHGGKTVGIARAVQLLECPRGDHARAPPSDVPAKLSEKVVLPNAQFEGGPDQCVPPDC